MGNEELVNIYEKRLGDAGYICYKLGRTNNRGDGIISSFSLCYFCSFNSISVCSTTLTMNIDATQLLCPCLYLLICLLYIRSLTFVKFRLGFRHYVKSSLSLKG